LHKKIGVTDAPSEHTSDADPRVAELVHENASLREVNTSLRGELTRAQSALVNLRARYHQLVEELHLLKRRLVVAKAERLEDVAAAQLAFDKLLGETQAIKEVLDAAEGTTAAGSEQAEANGGAAQSPQNKRKRTGAPPTGRRSLDKSGLPIVRVEIQDPELEGKAERIGVEEHSRVGYERGGYRHVVVARVVYKVATTASEETAVSNAGGRTSSEATPSTESTSSQFATAPMPKEIMKRGMLAPSMIAHLLTMKYVLGVPFHRYEKHCATEGFPLDRGTMCRYAEHVRRDAELHRRGCTQGGDRDGGLSVD